MADSSKAEFAQIASTNNSEVSTNGGVPYVNIPVLSPYGIVAVPPKGTRAVVLPTGDTAGVPQTVKDLKEGEIMLFSSGGASIILKNNGKVLINGKEM